VPTVLTLVRHGETPANVEGVWHGSIDSALTARGRRQARAVARHLAARGHPVAALYASPLLRARDTAAAIAAALGVEPAIEADLREYHLGSLEGTSYRELATAHRLFERMRDEPDFAPGGGESPREVASRFAAALRAIAARHAGERVVVVAHGGALTLGLGLLVDGDFSVWRRVMDNCAVSDLVLEPAPALLCFNEKGHLAALAEAEALAGQVLAFVRERDFVTFAALHRHFAGDAREETEIALPGNRVVWAGLPPLLVEAVLALLDDGLLAAVPGPKAAYVRDGRVLALPVERRAPPHATPHWLPVLLRPMEAVRDEAS
jgi:probable phosphoglycerate mutase